MKKSFLLLLISIVFQISHAQETDVNKVYKSAIKNYESKDYKKSANDFTRVIELIDGIENLSDYVLFIGASIFSGNKDEKETFRILNYLVHKRFYSNIDKFKNQDVFKHWQNKKEYQDILSKIIENKKTFPSRNRKKITTKLLEAKALLKEDNGKLWGHKIWSDNLIVIDYDKIIYSLVKLSDSKSDNDTLYYKTMEPNTLVFVNTTQKYQDKEYATVLRNYLKDKSSTIIHELFHLLHHKFRKLNGNSIDYLDETDARILLRLEFQALKNALTTIIENKDVDEVKTFLKDAVVFRKKRQKKYSKYLNDEVEIETLEGLANYTGFVLSSYENKYKKAIDEIEERERAKTYTRPFPYATGPAYGLIFDYLKIDWKKGLDQVYNFAKIYENSVLNSKLNVSKKRLVLAQRRNNFTEIYEQEKQREEEQNKLIAYYTNLLIKEPTLKVPVSDFDNYGRTYNMNGTMTLRGVGTVYSSIKGRDTSKGENFGDFFTTEGKDVLGVAGVLGYEKDGKNYFVFPLPTKITDTKIIGQFYEIELNPNWKVIKQKNGNMQVVKK
ncbi:hypothetical protein [Pseudotenacibaculum haliotis]|uniref:Uncharacterized protein n=1 Tax=Pseudotenacibaculum haliotis TaxID=1862138 RepID=A0ABW5LQJ1_9FLAO